MSYSEEKFREHIRAMVENTQVDSDRPLTLDELKELALSMGMIDSEWDALMIKAEESLELAKKHLTVKNFMNAFESAEEATSINPYILQGNATLAQAYYNLALLEKNDEYLIKANDYARRELVLDPMNSSALHVLSAVENQQSEGRYSKKLFKYLAIGGAIVLSLFVIVSFCSRQTINSDVKDIIGNTDTAKTRNISLANAVEEKERLFKDAVIRRNDFLLSWFASHGQGTDAIDEFQFSRLKESESKLKKALGKAKSENNFSAEENIQLEGLENRMAVEKKRWFEAITDYNSFLQSNPKASKEMNKIEFPSE